MDNTMKENVNIEIEIKIVVSNAIRLNSSTRKNPH